MLERSPRIRHYIGTIVAGCSLGGLLLAFALAFFFQSIESRSHEVRGLTESLGAVEEWKRSASAWTRDAYAALDVVSERKPVEERTRDLLVELGQLGNAPEIGDYQAELTRLRVGVEYSLNGLRIAPVPGTEAAVGALAELREGFDNLSSLIAQNTERIHEALRTRLQDVSVDLEARKKHVWRTIGLSTLAYAGLVLGLWRWVVRRLIRPLQALTEESRKTRDGETGFQLVPRGPYEVRLLTESLSGLVGGLVAARENLEEKVRERTMELERANQAKNEFLANMSHEIRTPMTAILGYAELCLAPDASETERQRYAEIIHTNGEHLLSVINDILDVSKIEAGRMKVEPTLCSPIKVVSDVQTLMEVRARAKGLVLSVRNEGPFPEVVRTDPTRLRQILLNLVNNAIKFTEQGSVVLTFGLEARPGKKLVFEVRDTGLGMTAEEIERVFRPFVQADTSTTRKFGGSGLGLAISRTLAQILGGDLTCRSVPGEGSSFQVTIDPGPLEGVRCLDHLPESAPARSASRDLAEPAAKLEGRVLLAEDVAVNRRLVATLLERMGLEVAEAENGRIALAKALSARKSSAPYDLIFMDMQMPEMDGYEATARLRKAGYRGPIVALTSHSMTTERQRCLEAGCDEYMTKPVDRKLLVQVLEKFLEAGRALRKAS